MPPRLHVASVYDGLADCLLPGRSHCLHRDNTWTSEYSRMSLKQTHKIELSVIVNNNTKFGFSRFILETFVLFTLMPKM